MSATTYFYPIGSEGKPWNDADRVDWLKTAGEVKRSYQEEVLAKLDPLKEEFDVEQYGSLSQDPKRYPLFCVKSRNWDSSKPSVLITGGVHGYETSGVQGALLFLKTKAKQYCEKFNLVVCPCVSPWGYECIQRWSSKAEDPNRSFMTNLDDCPTEEARAVVALVAQLKEEGKVEQWCMHVDMHETTDTDDSEFRPAKAARDGTQPDTSEIPDGFYLVGNSENPQADWHKAMIDSVRNVTHIAPTDTDGNLVGEPATQDGVLCVPAESLHLCMSVTNATYATTTEVYPDSKATPVSGEQCNVAQVACATGGLDFIIAKVL